MGWLWTSKDVPGMKASKLSKQYHDNYINNLNFIFFLIPQQPRKGWQPGMINKGVAKLMTFKCARGGPDKDKKKKKRKPGQAVGGGDSEPEEPMEPKPALRVQRKGDTFTIQVSSFLFHLIFFVGITLDRVVVVITLVVGGKLHNTSPLFAKLIKNNKISNT